LGKKNDEIFRSKFVWRNLPPTDNEAIKRFSMSHVICLNNTHKYLINDQLMG